MRILVGLVCMLWLATATASPRVKPKRATAEYPLAAALKFIDAQLADRDGDLKRAVELYEESLRHSQQANTHFNLAEIYLRWELGQFAREAFLRYLKRAPNATDRAEVERLIKQLEPPNALTTLQGRMYPAIEPDAIILVDGVVIGRSPQSVQLKPGSHILARVTATTYASREFTVYRTVTDSPSVSSHERDPKGNVVISGLAKPAHPWLGTGPGWTENGAKFVSEARFPLPVGRYSTSGSKGRGKTDPITCTPISFEVKDTTALTYVFVQLGAEDKARGCKAVTKVTVQQLRVTPP